MKSGISLIAMLAAFSAASALASECKDYSGRYETRNPDGTVMVGDLIQVGCEELKQGGAEFSILTDGVFRTFMSSPNNGLTMKAEFRGGLLRMEHVLTGMATRVIDGLPVAMTSMTSIQANLDLDAQKNIVGTMVSYDENGNVTERREIFQKRLGDVAGDSPATGPVFRMFDLR